METPDSSTISVEAVQQPGSETEFGQHLLSLTPFHPRKQILPSCAHVRYGDLQASGGPASPGINELRPPSDVLLQMDAAETQPLQYSITKMWMDDSPNRFDLKEYELYYDNGNLCPN